MFFGKIIFLCFTIYLLFYYFMGIWFSIEYGKLNLNQIWIGAIMILLIFMNVKIFQKEYLKWLDK